jgi:hypothetical protein
MAGWEAARRRQFTIGDLMAASGWCPNRWGDYGTKVI